MVFRIQTAAVLGLVLALAAPVLAEPVVSQQRNQVRMTPATDGKVPKAQQETVQKREKARQQRDAKLKIRDENSQAQGGPTTLKKPVKAR